MCHKHDDQPVIQTIALTRYVCKYWWDGGLDGSPTLHPSLEAAENDPNHSTCGIVEVQITLTRVVQFSEQDLWEPPEYQDPEYEEDDP